MVCWWHDDADEGTPSAVARGTVGKAAVVFALGGGALLLLAGDRSTPAVLVCVVCFGISNGMATLLRATLIGDFHGSNRYGAVSGTVSVFALAARAVQAVSRRLSSASRMMSRPYSNSAAKS